MTEREGVNRRAFLGTLAAGGAGLAVPPSVAAPSNLGTPARDPKRRAARETGEQRLHVDAQTDIPGVETFFLGNGLITVALQHATGEALERDLTPLGLMVWDPHHFCRKWSTFTFHPEWGLARSQLSVAIGGEPVPFDPATLHVERRAGDNGLSVIATWGDERVRVVETFTVDPHQPVLFRDVQVESRRAGEVALTTTLYYNHALFTDYQTDHAAGELRAGGFASIMLTATPRPTLADRYMTVVAERRSNGQAAARFTYSIASSPPAIPALDDRPTRTHIATGEADLDALFRAAGDGMRAVVAQDGRFDASVWQYNMEWVIDASGVAMGATRGGQFELAKSVLTNILTRLVNEKGITAHASRFRDSLDTELNQNGALLGAIWTYWAWTGDDAFVRSFWNRIRRVGDLPLRDLYLDPSGLVRSGIEFYERDANAGIEVGFDVGHQSLVAWGLGRGAELARIVGDSATERRWRSAGERMERSMLHHPTHSLTDGGRLISRRLPDGKRQATLIPHETSDLVPEGSELATSSTPQLDPTTATLYPLLLGQVPMADPLAQRTLDGIETLWREDGGGYLRYHPSGDPDAPGGWTFPTALVGQALARAGRGDGVRRVLDWFTSIQGARGGAYFEIYSDTARPVPPLPPLGIIPWGWGELASLFVHGILGAEPEPARNSVALAPLLPSGIDDLSASITIRQQRFDVRIRRAGRPRATYRGSELPVSKGRVSLPDDAEGGAVDIRLS